MTDKYNEFLLVLGIAFMFGGFAPILFKRMPISLPMLQVSFGALMGYFWLALPTLNPIENGTVVEKICEFVVLVSLFGAGVKLDTPLEYKYWQPTIRLLLVVMPICIAVMALLGYYVFELSLAATILLGAVLAPTDPVLAASIQVGAPNTGNERPSRFALTSEAGLNDGLAFPFVYLAIVIAENYGQATTVSADVLWEWFKLDVVWRIFVGTVVGVLVGKLVGKMVFSKFTQSSVLSQGYIAIALTLLAYGIAEFVHSYGFISVFVAGFMFRSTEYKHEYHRSLHDFSEQFEGLLMSLVLITFGMALGQALYEGMELTWQVYAVSLLALFVIRPIAGWIGLSGTGLDKKERFLISSLGIRGIGTFYYLAYALNKGVFEQSEAGGLWIICAVIVVISIFIHGMSAPKLMDH